MRPTPPCLSDALLRLMLGRNAAEAIAGDLEEMFRARLARQGRAAAGLWRWRLGAPSRFRSTPPEVLAEKWNHSYSVVARRKGDTSVAAAQSAAVVLGVVVGAAGIALGVLPAIPSMRALTALLYEVDPADPAVIALLAASLLVIALVAGYLPARRAASVDPLVTLRAE